MPSLASKREEKAVLRAQAKRIRDDIDVSERERLSSGIVDKVRALGAYQKARIVALYIPIQSEADLRELTQDPDKRFCYPRIIDAAASEMEFALADDGFEPGMFGLSEPIGQTVKPRKIDLILVPGVAFDPKGHRIGYGKGFYDHYLIHYRHVTAGVCFSAQILEDVPSGKDDIAMDWIVTEKGALCIKP